MDEDNADDLALLINKPNQDKSPLHSFEEATRSIGLNMNSDITKFLSVHHGVISTLNGKPLKL